jgi:hypothetical protein
MHYAYVTFYSHTEYDMHVGHAKFTIASFSSEHLAKPLPALGEGAMIMPHRCVGASVNISIPVLFFTISHIAV